MKDPNEKSSFFNERAFLIRALMGIFIIQFVTVGYQIYACQSATKSVRELEKVTLMCQNASNSFNETGKLALATFLALLVPSGATPTNTSSRSKTKASSDMSV